MKEIQLTRGMVAFVDDSDFEWASKWKWCARPGGHGVWYACRRKRRAESERRVGNIDMHVAMLGPSPLGYWDHIDRNGLNNQRQNLRPCTNSNNQGNRGLIITNTSGLKGVCWKQNAWNATIYKMDRGVHLGRFRDKIDAAKAYDEAALEHFGPFAVTNASLGLI